MSSFCYQLSQHMCIRFLRSAYYALNLKCVFPLIPFNRVMLQSLCVASHGKLD